MELRSLNMFQHGKASVHKTSFVKTWFAKVTTKELKWPVQSFDLNPTEHFR